MEQMNKKIDTNFLNSINSLVSLQSQESGITGERLCTRNNSVQGVVICKGKEGQNKRQSKGWHISDGMRVSLP